MFDEKMAKLHNHGVAVMIAAAALASAKTPKEAYEAQHVLEQRVNAASEIFDNYAEHELGFEGDIRFFPDPLEIEKRGHKSGLLKNFA